MPINVQNQIGLKGIKEWYWQSSGNELDLLVVRSYIILISQYDHVRNVSCHPKSLFQTRSPTLDAHQ